MRIANSNKASLFNTSFTLPQLFSAGEVFLCTAPDKSRNGDAKKTPDYLISVIRSIASLVSPGFEPRQRESKSLVLPLHHETTQ